jgi:Predicted transcriptional regulators
MSVLVPIGDFSRMTHLSVKALRFYHDQGLLEPAGSTRRAVTASTTPARFRWPRSSAGSATWTCRWTRSGRPEAPDVETRTKEIIAHLTAMETKLAELQMSVSSLRALLEGPAIRPEVEFRSIPADPGAGRPGHGDRPGGLGLGAPMSSARSTAGSSRPA